MVSRQIGHFFFEPKDYDYVNQATHEHKEAIKVGYNLYRKVILLTIWAVSPLILYIDPNLLGMFEPHAGAQDYLYNLSLLSAVAFHRVGCRGLQGGAVVQAIRHSDGISMVLQDSNRPVS
jgi:hypothetical protein